MKLHNLRGTKPTGYTTWGCMWKQGECASDATFCCKNEAGREIEIQSRITAYWPDGSVKWSAHTADAAKLGNQIDVFMKTKAIENDTCVRKEKQGLLLEETKEWITIDAGCYVMHIAKKSNHLFEKIEVQERTVLLNATPVLQLEHPVEAYDTEHGEATGEVARLVRNYIGTFDKVTVEESGDLQAIIKYEGIHVWKNEKSESKKMPFIIRMTLGKDISDIRFVHTFLYDGDENKDFLKGLGIQFFMPLSGEVYNRHIKVMGDSGMFHEALVPMMAWRPRIPQEIYARQLDGETLFLDGLAKEIVDKVLQDTPYWSEYNICQDSPSHFLIKKKLKEENLCYIDCLHGKRTKGGCAFGSKSGSVIMTIRDFWEKYPSGYCMKNLDGDVGECTMWFWAPEASAFDFRHYANRGYNQVCYEGYDYKGAEPKGIACTNECAIRLCSEMIPSDEKIVAFCESVNEPIVYVGTPEFYHERKAFGYWSLPSYNTQMEQWLEEQLEKAAEFYKQEVGQRGWYGMFNYGDFMHTYDSQRHQWKYDIGGYAWDNTELVPTLWLWLYFMRTGRADIFTLAEKLSRHASEVDVYHFGKYKGLGSRHNVRHWGCPCKEARIAMAAHHRFLYYLTGDRRLEDIFEELKDNELSFLQKDPLGDFYDKKDMVFPSHARSGPDWSSLCSNWMTEWERKNDNRYRDKIVTGIEDIKKAPLQLSSGPDFEFDPETVHLRYIGERTTGGCHLQVCMGAPSVWMEIADLLGDESFKKMIADHGRFYYLPREKQMEESKGIIGNREFTLPFMSAAMGAYGAAYLKDDWLAKRTWQILLETLIHDGNHEGFHATVATQCGNHEELVEIPWITTNFTAQWCLNVIMVLAFIRDALPQNLSEADMLVKDSSIQAFRKA